MTTLYIMGAGASRNYTQGTHRIKGLQMPLDNDFFQMARKAIVSDTRNWGYPNNDIDHFLKDIWSLYGKQIAENPENDFSIFDDNRLSLEAIMSMFYQYNLFDKDLYLGVYDEGVKQRRLRTLIKMIVYTLSVAQKGPICDKHLALSRSMKEGDVVISYNYDSILDDALRRTKMLSDSGYLLDFFRVFDGKNWRALEDKVSKVILLKLHGSLNWLECKRCRSKFLYDVRINFKTTYETEDYVYSECMKCKARRSAQPVIVPPLIGKDYNETIINYLWSEAYEILTQNKSIEIGNTSINNIVVIGYRLPDSDIASQYLFLKLNHSLIWANHNVSLTIVNPDKTVVERFKNIFSSSKVKVFHYTNIEEYFDKL